MPIYKDHGKLYRGYYKSFENRVYVGNDNDGRNERNMERESRTKYGVESLASYGGSNRENVSQRVKGISSASV